MSKQVIISRINNGTVWGADRCYVTGPHFGSKDIFSGTLDSAKATRYTVEEAVRLMHQRCWGDPRMEKVKD